MRIRRSGEERRGAATVELAFILPVLLIVLCGIWEVGRMVDVQQLLLNAAREGGRQAAGGGKTAAEVKAGVIEFLNRAGINTTNVVVSVENLTNPSLSDPSDAVQLDQLRITVTLPFANVNWAAMNYVTTGGDLKATVVWRSLKDKPVTIDINLPVE